MRKTIVCIDRRPADLLRIQSILDSRYPVVLMADATLALREIQRLTPGLILLGTDTAGMGSVELVNHLSELDPSLLSRLIVLAHDSELSQAKTLTSEGACAVVQKPLIPDELIFAVQAMFARSNSREPSNLQRHMRYMKEQAS